MIFGDEDKIVPVISYVSWRDIMQDSWGQNFRTKNGRQVSLTGCSGSSKARWTDVRAATDCEVPARMKNGQLNDMVLSQEDELRTHSTVRDISWKAVWQAFLSHPLSASYGGICRWKNALRGDVGKSWLRRNALFVNYFWLGFSSLPRLYLVYRWKRCSLWMQQWKNYENQLRFRRVKTNKIKRILRTQCNFD